MTGVQTCALPISVPIEAIPLPKPAPETILKKVEQAATKNIPLEALFERRHEIKDAPPVDRQADRTVLTGIGGAAGQPQDQIAAASPSPTTDPLADTSAKPATAGGSTSTTSTKKAAKSGVLAGLLLLILLAIWLLIR